MTIYFLLSTIGLICGFLLLQKIPKLPQNKLDIANIKISIIIPARNEQKTLPLLLTDLKKQVLNIHEIICVDDNSTDDTLRIIKDFGVKYVKVRSKPSDWTGKTWACQKGAEKATGDVLIFIDADVRMDSHGIYRLMCEHVKQGSVLAVQPYHKVTYFYEHFALFFNLVGVAASGASMPWIKKKIGLFGPLIVMRKSDFNQIGGYYHVRKSVIEDVALGAFLNKKGIQFKLLVGDHNLSFRMYQNFKELFLGFTKNFASGATSTPPFILILTISWIQSMTAWPVTIARALYSANSNKLLLALIMYTIICLHLLFITKKIGSFKKRYVLIYPLFLCFFHIVFLYSLYLKICKKKVKWKGRDISLK